MLENGADIRYIQAMLGHASLETTEITRVSVQKLRKTHDATHSAANFTPPHYGHTVLMAPRSLRTAVELF